MCPGELPLDAPGRTAFVLNFELLNFEFVSDFVLRASDFIFTRRFEYSLILAGRETIGTGVPVASGGRVAI